MKIIKANSYIPVSGEPFDMPIPNRLELYYSNILLCVYMISDNKAVDFTYNINTDIPVLTPVHRKLKMEDIYFLIRSRIFPDNPYTAPAELSRFGLAAYEPYKILKKTHGILPIDSYWIKPADEDIDYSGAMEYYMDHYRLTPEQRAEKYKFRNDGETEDFSPTSFESIESFLGM